MEPNFDPPYEIILKAGDDRDGPNITMRLSDTSKVPDRDELVKAVSAPFEEVFGHAPARVGIAVLPWYDDEDEASESRGSFQVLEPIDDPGDL